MKKLIINADDLGADVARNEGIFEAIEAGVVTAASILVNGPAFRDVLERIVATHGNLISFGIHLNLTEGMPLSPGLKFITGPDGCFCGKAEGHRRLMKSGDAALEKEIWQECAAQITALRDAGVRIDHIDGHQHVHMFPAVVNSALRAGRVFGIPWIRIPEEPPPFGFMDRQNHMRDEEAEKFTKLAAAVRTGIHDSTMSMTDHFRGLYLKGRMSLRNIEGILSTLPMGLTELMVHPGRVPAGLTEGPFSSFSHGDRETELKVLMDGNFRVMLAKHNILLTPFPEVCH